MVFLDRHFIDGITEITDEEQRLNEAIHVACGSFIYQSLELGAFSSRLHYMLDLKLEYHLLSL